MRVPAEVHCLLADRGFLMDLPKKLEYVIEGGSTDDSESRGNHGAEGVAE